IVRAMVSNKDFETAMKEKIGDNLDVTNLESEIKNLRTQLRKKETNKATLIQQIDDLDPDDKNYSRKASDLNDRLEKFYYDIDEIDRQIEDAEKRLASVQQNKINSDTIYRYLLYFDRYYDSFTDAEKKEFMQSFIESIEIFEQKQEDGRFLKSIEFKFPVYFNGGYVKRLGLTDENTLETVACLTRSFASR
ncbi:MAG: recombinase family protein, partial [Clostridia bacterium]|nr:recombinase family protein [Clostridia bacterium]